jgi:membrane-associated phospholipid phosphatase
MRLASIIFFLFLSNTALGICNPCACCWPKTLGQCSTNMLRPCSSSVDEPYFPPCGRCAACYTLPGCRNICKRCHKLRKKFCGTGWPLRRTFNLIGGTIKDAFLLNANLISAESFIVIASTLPIYLASRLVDEHIQCHFFTHETHKNINQLPKWCHELVRFGVGVPIVLFGSQLFLSNDPEWREAAWMLLLGIPFVIFGKDIIKKFDAEWCLRPWHEDFCKPHKQSMGGFPSGHMAQAAYIATLYGMRFGPKVAIPLSFFAAALGIVFLNCNRHYLSQMIAGVGLGAMYGIAANKVIDSKLCQDITVGLCFDRGMPGIKACYRF